MKFDISYNIQGLCQMFVFASKKLEQKVDKVGQSMSCWPFSRCNKS